MNCLEHFDDCCITLLDVASAAKLGADCQQREVIKQIAADAPGSDTLQKYDACSDEPAAKVGQTLLARSRELATLLHILEERSARFGRIEFLLAEAVEQTVVAKKPRVRL